VKSSDSKLRVNATTKRDSKKHTRKTNGSCSRLRTFVSSKYRLHRFFAFLGELIVQHEEVVASLDRAMKKFVVLKQLPSGIL
jgi:hypothetical protein